MSRASPLPPRTHLTYAIKSRVHKCRPHLPGLGLGPSYLVMSGIVRWRWGWGGSGHLRYVCTTLISYGLIGHVDPAVPCRAMPSPAEPCRGGRTGSGFRSRCYRLVYGVVDVPRSVPTGIRGDRPTTYITFGRRPNLPSRWSSSLPTKRHLRGGLMARKPFERCVVHSDRSAARHGTAR